MTSLLLSKWTTFVKGLWNKYRRRQADFRSINLIPSQICQVLIGLLLILIRQVSMVFLIFQLIFFSLFFNNRFRQKLSFQILLSMDFFVRFSIYNLWTSFRTILNNQFWWEYPTIAITIYISHFWWFSRSTSTKCRFRLVQISFELCVDLLGAIGCIQYRLNRLNQYRYKKCFIKNV